MRPKIPGQISWNMCSRKSGACWRFYESLLAKVFPVYDSYDGILRATARKLEAHGELQWHLRGSSVRLHVCLNHELTSHILYIDCSDAAVSVDVGNIVLYVAISPARTLRGRS